MFIPFHLFDFYLPKCQTGLVYPLISCINSTFSYIVMRNCISRRIFDYESGFLSQSSIPPQLIPYDVFAYICVFDKKKVFLFRVERQWNIKSDYIRNWGIHCQKQWAVTGTYVIDDVHNYLDEKNYFCPILLFIDRDWNEKNINQFHH